MNGGTIPTKKGLDNESEFIIALFILFSDTDFATEVIEYLEDSKKENGQAFQCCHHKKDFVVGKFF
jgi:hypothetical protein